MPNTNDSRIVITPLKPALILGVAQKLPVLVRVQAPAINPAVKKERRPYHLALVLDRSGSMSGAPLREAVRCARHIVDRLTPTDVASLVVFDDGVDTLVPAVPVGDRAVLHGALAQVAEGGTTNLHGGWQSGATSLLPNAANAALARVLLLSDGRANVGETDTSVVAALCAEAAEKGVTTSTYGLGHSFNEELMVEMANRGGGSHYYGEDASDLFESFVTEFDLISNLFARQVRLSLAAPEGIRIKLLNDYAVEQREGFPLIRLPDVPFGAEAWALVELEIPAGMALESGTSLLQAAVTASNTDGDPISFPDVTLTLSAMSHQAWDALLPDPLVVARQAELEAGLFLAKARAAAERGEWRAIEQMLAEAHTRFAGQPWLTEVLAGMAELARARDQARFSKEAMYSARKMGGRVSARDENLDTLAQEALAPSYLRRKPRQGKAAPELPPGNGNK